MATAATGGAPCAAASVSAPTISCWTSFRAAASEEPFLKVEIELKLAAPPAVLEQVLALPALASLIRSPASDSTLISHYYDTPDCALRRHGMALRLRRVGGRWVQTLKSKGRVEEGLATRLEFDHPSDGATLDFSEVPDAALRAFLESPAVRPRLAPCFTTEFRRVAQQLDCPDGTVVELALDRGEVRAGGAAAPIAEVELELLSGNPERLQELGALLQRHLPLVAEPVSKAERGYRLLPGCPAET
ncbi:MAG: CYTH domain-containing protein [Betaproteobacteria bacterium]|nr:CYTH domain-containing protein [Betaproteobacteria bacterium]